LKQAEKLDTSNGDLTEVRKLNLVVFFAFAFGCVCIGLVLLDHEHCEPEGAGHDAHGH